MRRKSASLLGCVIFTWVQKILVPLCNVLAGSKWHLFLTFELNFWQRLEFLGDSVLDLLITWHLYQSHTDIDPGELTDLRSASVNNENFAQATVKKNLYKHLQHCSTLLLSQITEYVKSFPKPGETTDSGPSMKAPKVSSFLGLCYICISIVELMACAVCICYVLILLPMQFAPGRFPVLILLSFLMHLILFNDIFT